MIGRRSDDGHELRPAFLGDADADDFEPIGLALELGPVTGELLVIRQAVVVPHVESEVLLGGRDGGRVGGMGSEHCEGDE